MWPSVELRELHVFLAVAEELHFGRAADRLEIGASRVSQVIRELEDRIGGRLFERTSRRVRITPLGEQLQAALTGPYHELLEAVAVAHETATGVAGVLRLGMYTPINGGPHLLEIIRAFEDRYPRCKVSLIDTGIDRDQLDWLREGDADVLAMRLPLNSPEIVTGPILSHEPRVLAVALDHPLASEESVSVEDLASYTVPKVPGLPPEMMQVLMPSRTPSGKTIRTAELRSISEAMMRVASKETVHPTVPSFAEYHQHPGVVTIPIRDLPPSETALVWLKAHRSPKVEAFSQTAAAVLAQHPLDKGQVAPPRSGSQNARH
jgi:DNA-binding transcriptional LysR family regulator